MLRDRVGVIHVGAPTAGALFGRSGAAPDELSLRRPMFGGRIMTRSLIRILVVVALIAAALSVFIHRRVAVGPAPDGSSARGSAAPDIVVIVMDTARQDRLSCYGYDRETSPRLSELAESATVFERAYSTSSWTSPAHASLFTGLYPATHGVTQEHWRMSEGLVTLAEVLSDHGYETVGIVENSILSSEHGFHQGFSSYHVTRHMQRALDALGDKARSETGNLATDLFLRTIREERTGEPLFVFVNLIPPHQPYDSSKQFMNEFLSDRDISLVDNMWPEYYIGTKTFTGAELTHLNELYDAEILYTDYLVGLMMDGIKAQGRWDDTAVFVLSDHGENIGDHGHMDHVFSLYETTVRVPFIVHAPSPRAQASGAFEPGSVNHSPASLVDVFPTVMDMAGIEAEEYPSQGFSLLSVRPNDDRAIVAEYYWPVQALGAYDVHDAESPLLDPYRRRLRSITVGSSKLIWGSDGRYELFDLDTDPGESNSLLESNGDGLKADALTARLGQMVDGFESERVVDPVSVRPDELSDETREALRSLGYLE
jgi:arylsulfatase A-like enzyme